MSNKVTQKLIKSLFHYREGCLYWKCGSGRRIGKKAGYLDKSTGRHYINLFKSQWKISRLVYFMFNGILPKFVDHINNDVSDDNIDNLRACSRSENNQNRRTPKNNTSGVKSVYFNKRAGKWVAGVRYNGKYHHVGLFEDINSANDQVIIARNNLHGKFANNG